MKPIPTTSTRKTNLPAPRRGAAVLVPFTLWEQYIKEHQLDVTGSWWDERDHRICIAVRPACAAQQQTEVIDI